MTIIRVSGPRTWNYAQHLQLFRLLLTVENAKSLIIIYLCLSYVLQSYRHLRGHGLSNTFKDGWIWIQKQIIFLYLRTPSGKTKVRTQLAQTRETIVSKLVPNDPTIIRHHELPSKGRSLASIEEEMSKLDVACHATDYRLGKLSGAVYHGGEELGEVISTAIKKYLVSNPLHPDAFPVIRKMEAEIVAMCLKMFNNPQGAGTTTSGGTESIVMSVKTHRDWARATKGIKSPEMVIPASAHPAFLKAASYLNIKVFRIPVDPITRKVSISKIVGSAVNFPDGCMDDIEALGKLAQKYKIGLHVDCCLGSFIVPFLNQAGFYIEPFDFRVPGVTSISCDTHKDTQGSSVIMYRSAELRKYQYYIYAEWAGGLYASPSLAGSRPGALIAGTWAVMQYMGHDGYLESCRSIVSCAKKIKAGVENEIPELYIIGDPPASVIAIGSKDASTVNIFEVGDAMSKRGWHLSALNDPPGFHMACTRLTVTAADLLITDLKECVQEAKSSPPGSGTMVNYQTKRIQKKMVF
ncbi:hypothetical protein Clacol_000627 [Clathrus columnatus]|uniref:sphinganine-1-phosphate aldolase n=1 Tax=Clathrus columnatus TaxID=1419009 RepID=A0AAV4ZXG3_9AGAM|nr:hypothetical protein Clacol_000627 [Clathrus columnatus]